MIQWPESLSSNRQKTYHFPKTHSTRGSMKNKYTCSPIFSEEKKIALLEGFQKQNTHTTVAEYAKAKNVNKSSLRGWSVRYGIPLGHHHRNHRKPLPKEQRLVLLNGFQKQSTYTTVAEYAKANNVSRPALCKWSIYYRIPLGNHYTRRIQQTPYGRAISTALANRRSGDGA